MKRAAVPRSILLADEGEGVAPSLAPQREVLPQRIAFGIVVRHQDANEVRVVPETDAHHVEHFALHEIRALPDIRHGIDDTVVFRYARLHPVARTAADRIDLVHDLEPFRLV